MSNNSPDLDKLLRRLAESRGPHTHSIRGGSTDIPELITSVERDGGLVRTIDGQLITDDEAFFQLIAAAWEFPAWCGRNWNALDDCLSDLRWLPAPAYVTVVTGWTSVAATGGLAEDIVRTFERIGEYRADPMPGGVANPPPAAFHLVTASP